MLYSRESRTTVLFLALVTSLTVLCHSVDVTTVFTTSTITEITTVTAAPQPQNKAETALNTATNIIQTMQFPFNCAPFKWKGPFENNFLCAELYCPTTHRLGLSPEVSAGK
nr:AKR_HP1_G0045440.mRNA.1.CDS.1 [Saccharomyces cerevisiae]